MFSVVPSNSRTRSWVNERVILSTGILHFLEWWMTGNSRAYNVRNDDMCSSVIVVFASRNCGGIIPRAGNILG